MRKPPQKRRILKWTGLVACALLTLTIVLSCWWSISWSRGNYWGYVQWGGVAFNYHNRVNEFRWDVRRTSPTVPPYWWFHNYPGNQYVSPDFVTPLWLPLAAIGVPTILAWRRDRPFPPGHCQNCGYDLTGNISGACPECGVAVDRKRVHTI